MPDRGPRSLRAWIRRRRMLGSGSLVKGHFWSVELRSSADTSPRRGGEVGGVRHRQHVAAKGASPTAGGRRSPTGVLHLVRGPLTPVLVGVGRTSHHRPRRLDWFSRTSLERMSADVGRVSRPRSLRAHADPARRRYGECGRHGLVKGHLYFSPRRGGEVGGVRHRQHVAAKGASTPAGGRRSPTGRSPASREGSR